MILKIDQSNQIKSALVFESQFFPFPIFPRAAQPRNFRNKTTTVTTVTTVTSPIATNRSMVILIFIPGSYIHLDPDRNASLKG